MTTFTMRALQRLHRTNDVAWTREALAALGKQRLDQEAQGGALYALFADFCWSTERDLSRELFELWLVEVHVRQAGAEDVAAARKALEARP